MRGADALQIAKYAGWMWDWFKKKRATAIDSEAEKVARKWLGPQALAVAVAESVREHFDAVEAGTITFPAHRRKGSSVVSIWRDLRLEALRNLFGFGEADPFLLSDQQRQSELLRCFIDERPHLEIPQPRGEQVPDTIQAMWQVYVYLSDVGSEVADRETDRATLKLARRSILDSLTEQSAELRGKWDAFEQAVRSSDTTQFPEMPRTLIEVLYEDVTAKAKSIALSTIFGPSYEDGIEYMINLVSKDGRQTQDVRASVDRVLAANDPDEYTQSGG